MRMDKRPQAASRTELHVTIHVSTGLGQGGVSGSLLVRDGFVVRAGPELSLLLGRSLQHVREWVASRNGSIAEHG